MLSSADAPTEWNESLREGLYRDRSHLFVRRVVYVTRQGLSPGPRGALIVVGMGVGEGMGGGGGGNLKAKR